MSLKKVLILLSGVGLLTGCFDDTSDLQQYVTEIKQTVSGRIEPMDALEKFNHVDYAANEQRSPFAAPRPEAIVAKLQQISNCLAPDPRRRRQPLEKFAIDTLKMRGTIGEKGVTWALIEASDGTLHRLAQGHYLGLYHGQITKVGQEKIEIVELIPDGAGCWNERETSIEMQESD